MRKSTAATLTVILIAAIAVRLLPLWSFLYWGSDAGEYYAILLNLVRTGHIVLPYYGWGLTYPEFPGMFFPQAGLVELGGLNLLTVLNVAIPILGAFAIVPLFLIATAITREARFGLFAAAFLAGAIPHAYTTAHTAPATLGDLFALTALLLFIRLEGDRRAMVPLVTVTAALIVTHHLSGYFYLLMVVGTIVVRGLVRPWRGTAGEWREVRYAVFLGIATFAYWFGYASTFRDAILPDVNLRPWWLLLAAFPVLVVVLAGVILARRRIAWRYRPSYPTLRRAVAVYVTALSVIAILGVASTVATVPGTTFSVSFEGLVYFLPLVLLMGFAASGRGFFDFLRRGIEPTAWFLALVGSATVGIVVAPRVLIPYRHMEFIAFPIALFVGVGFFRILDFVKPLRATRVAVGVVVGILVAGNLLAGIPPPSTLGGWREGTVPQALDPAYWARDHVNGLVVSDHQGSTLVFGFGGINATWDRTRDLYLSKYASDPACFQNLSAWKACAFAGLEGIDSPSGLKNATYIWIDRDMEAGLRLTPWEAATPMDPNVIAKFDQAPFVKVFDNGYARLYWIVYGCVSPSC